MEFSARILVVSFLCLFSATLQAQTKWTWDTNVTPGIQPGNGTWGTDAFWTTQAGSGTVLVPWPGISNHAYFEGSDGAYTISVNGTQQQTVYSLTIQVTSLMVVLFYSTMEF